MTFSRSSSRQPVSRFSRSIVLRRWLRLWITMLFSAGVRYILNFRFFIGRSSFTLSLYVERTLHRKCAIFLTNQHLCGIYIKANAAISNFSWRIRLSFIDTGIFCFGIFIHLLPKIILDYARCVHSNAQL